MSTCHCGVLSKTDVAVFRRILSALTSKPQFITAAMPLQPLFNRSSLERLQSIFLEPFKSAARTNLELF
jgi:hypothetical protein